MKYAHEQHLSLYQGVGGAMVERTCGKKMLPAGLGLSSAHDQ